MAGVAAVTAIAADTVMAMDMPAAGLTAGHAVMLAPGVVMPAVHAVTPAALAATMVEFAGTAVAHVADLAAGAHVADSAAVVVTWAVAAATAVADTGKFLIFPQNPRSCGIPPEKARLLRQAGLFCRV
jgi:hypothetical protein